MAGRPGADLSTLLSAMRTAAMPPDWWSLAACRGDDIALSTRICTVEDLAAANLAGLASPTGWPLHPGLAGLLGFTAYFWAEGAQPDLDTPFAYADVAAIQARAKALADDGVLRLPARWPLPIQPW